MKRTPISRRRRKCAHCGGFFQSPYANARYCSRECSNRATAVQRGLSARGPRPKQRKQRKTRCDFCGQEFERVVGELNRRKGHYCSRDCLFAALKADGGRERHKPSATESTFRVFNLKLKGEKKCRCCGRRARHLHHAIPRSMSKVARTDLRNGLPLCPTCHQGWHFRTVTIYRDVFTAEEWAYLLAVPDTGRIVAAWLDDRYPPRT